MVPFFIRIERDPNVSGYVRLLGSFTADMSDSYRTDSRSWEYFRFHLQNTAGIEPAHLGRAEEELKSKHRVVLPECLLLPVQVDQLGFTR